MNLFPKLWQVSSANAVCAEIVDCLNKTAPVVEHDTGYRMIRTTNVRHGQVDVEENRFVEEGVFNKWTRRARPKRGDIILSREAPLGEVGLLRSDAKVFLGQRTMLYRADPEKLDQQFLYYQMIGPYVQAQIHGQGSGSTVAHLRVPDAETLLIPVAPLKTQRKIAAILSAYDELIENNQRRIALLEKMAEEIYREWFVRFRFPGYENTRKVKGVPEGWKTGKLGSIVCSIKEKYVDLEHQEWPLVDLEKMSQRSLAVTNTGHPVELSTSRIIFARNDILFSTIRPYLYKVNMTPFQGVTNTSVLVLRPRIPEYRSFVTMTLFMGSTIAWADQYSTGTKMPVISWNVFQQMEFFDPGLHLAAKFNDLVSPTLDQINTLSILNRRLAQSRDLLLPRLISGKLSVENLDIQFPPSMEETAYEI